jgi:VCBS repeat-containing protein
VRLNLVGRGGVKLGQLKGSLSKAGSRTFKLKLDRKARRIVRRFHSGTLTLRLAVKSKDGQQQTVARTLHLKR